MILGYIWYSDAGRGRGYIVTILGSMGGRSVNIAIILAPHQHHRNTLGL